MTSTPAPTPTYEERLQSLDLTPVDQLKTILKNSTKVTFLDVRGPEEIAAAPLNLPSNIQKKSNSVSCACSRTDATALVKAATSTSSEGNTPLLPEKDATIIIFCKSGARAKTGKLALQEAGYTKVRLCNDGCRILYSILLVELLLSVYNMYLTFLQYTLTYTFIDLQCRWSH